MVFFLPRSPRMDEGKNATKDAAIFTGWRARVGARMMLQLQLAAATFFAFEHVRYHFIFMSFFTLARAQQV